MTPRDKAAEKAVKKLLERQRCAVRNEDPDRPIYKGVEQLLRTLASLNARRLAGHPTPPPGVRMHADLLYLLDVFYGAKESRAGERGAPESLALERLQVLALDATGELVPPMLKIANNPTPELCADTRAQLNTLQTLLRMIEGKLCSGERDDA